MAGWCRASPVPRSTWRCPTRWPSWPAGSRGGSRVISVRGLCKRHGTSRVLEGVSAEVAAGERIAVVGPSGGGKSTLLRCLNYLEPFDAGEVEIAGFRLTP